MTLAALSKAVLSLAVLTATSLTFAVEYRLEAAADTTIFADTSGGTQSDGLSDGGPNLWLSATVGGQTRRALIRFDLSAIPAGSTITSVQLTLYQLRARGEHPVRVHRLLAPWGEATSNAGGSGSGVAARPGDATWSHRFFPQVPWSQRGGDFIQQASTSLTVGLVESAFTWPSTQTAVADAQSWLDQPSSNHGWILVGDDVNDGTAKRLGSREGATAALRPVLVVQATPPAANDSADTPLPLWASALLGAGLLALIRRKL